MLVRLTEFKGQVIFDLDIARGRETEERAVLVRIPTLKRIL